MIHVHGYWLIMNGFRIKIQIRVDVIRITQHLHIFCPFVPYNPPVLYMLHVLSLVG